MSNIRRTGINSNMRKNTKGKLTKKDEASIDKMLDNLPEAPKSRVPRNLTQAQRTKLAMHMKNMLDEYLDCFVLVGYTTDGLRMFMTEVNSPLEQDAINNLLMET